MFKKYLLFFSVLVLVVSCSKDDDVGPLSAYDNSVINYFDDVALGFEFGGASEITRKWTSEMKIFVGGKPTPDLLNELGKIVTEINELSSDNFSMRVVSDTLQSNFYIFFGHGNTYATIVPSQAPYVSSNWGLFAVNWNSANEISNGHMYVDVVRANTIEQKHLLREELTQSLGLAKDSFQYPESIFQQNWTTTTQYAGIDRDLIRLLYHPDMKIGLNKEQVDQVLTEIILSEK